MEITTQVLDISIVIVLFIVLFFQIFLSSYFTKIGENFATKKDVADITRKIEEVKIDFASQRYILIKKREVYEKIINSMRVFIQGHSATSEEKNQMLEAYSLTWLWANDKVLKMINDHLKLQIEKVDPQKSVTQDQLKETYTNCILEMRKESRNISTTSLEGNDFLFINFL